MDQFKLVWKMTPMKGISLILGNEVESKKCHRSKMAKMSAKNEEDKMARMAAEPRARYKQHSRSQSRKVESKEVKLPHLKKPKDRGTGHQRKDETPKNNGNKFPNTYREDKRKIRGPPQMAKKEFKKGEEVLLLSPDKEPHCGGGYIGPYVVSQGIDKRTYRIDTHEGKKKTRVCQTNRLKRYVLREGPPRKLKNSDMPNKFKEKLSHLSVSERKDLEKLMNKYPGLFSDNPSKKVVAEWSFTVLRERKRETEKRNFLPQSLIFKRDDKLVKNMEKGSKRKRRGRKEFSSPMLKYKRNEREVRQHMTKRRKEKERKRNFLPLSLIF